MELLLHEKKKTEHSLAALNTYWQHAAGYEKQNNFLIWKLARINAAIARLNAHTYGNCLACGQAIRQERLEIMPYAEYCLDCQNELEELLQEFEDILADFAYPKSQ